jgi:hypothetical protein
MKLQSLLITAAFVPTMVLAQYIAPIRYSNNSGPGITEGASRSDALPAGRGAVGGAMGGTSSPIGAADTTPPTTYNSSQALTNSSSNNLPAYPLNPVSELNALRGLVGSPVHPPGSSQGEEVPNEK